MSAIDPNLSSHHPDSDNNLLGQIKNHLDVSMEKMKQDLLERFDAAHLSTALVADNPELLCASMLHLINRCTNYRRRLYYGSQADFEEQKKIFLKRLHSGKLMDEMIFPNGSLSICGFANLEENEDKEHDVFM